MDSAAEPTRSEPQPRFEYNAFISYRRESDRAAARKLHHALHHFAKPLFSIRSMRIFRDEQALVGEQLE